MKQKSKKVADQASRQAAHKTTKRLKQAVRTSKKRNEGSLKAPTRATPKKRPIAAPTAAAEAISVTVIRRSTFQQNIDSCV